MILVCASGLSSSTADDVAKEVAIYQAHMACPIIIATEGEDRFSAASAVITVPPVHPSLAYILSTMAGHLFGYRAALAIDALALPLRRARGVIEEVAADPQLRDNAINSLETRLQKPWTAFRKELIAGNYDGALEARTAARLTSLFNYVLGFVPLESYAIEFGQPGTPGTIVDSLVEELTQAIDQMTRPVDAIKHQAKTVTVGISREAIVRPAAGLLIKHMVTAGASADDDSEPDYDPTDYTDSDHEVDSDADDYAITLETPPNNQTTGQKRSAATLDSDTFTR